MFASFIDIREIRQRVRSSCRVNPHNIIVDTTMYAHETNDKNEGLYLVSFFNSSVIETKIYHFRERRQKGHPHIHKKIFDFNIPIFNPKDKRHQELVRLGEQCVEKVAEWLKTQLPKDIRSIGKIRSLLRQYLEPELQQIDAIVQSLLK